MKYLLICLYIVTVNLLFTQMTMGEIDSLIIENRTTPITIELIDINGLPVMGRDIEILQLSHTFDFGCVTAGNLPAFDPEIKEMYKDTLLKYFNSTVDELNMKWKNVEPSQDYLVFNSSDYIYNWSMENNLKFRGHTLFWANETKVPGWAKDLSDGDLLIEMKEHVSDMLQEYPDINEWDLNNEMVIPSGNFSPYYYYRSRFGDSIIDSMLTWSREINPNARYFLNEPGVFNGLAHQDYIDMIQGFLDQGISFDGIGIQGHIRTDIDESLPDPELPTGNGEIIFSATHLWTILEGMAQFNLPIKITEFGFNAPDETTHALWLTNFMKVMYAHPMVEGVIRWGFWEGATYQNEMTIFDINFNPKPSALAYYNLVYEEWWTNDTMQTDLFGKIEIELHHGNHSFRILDTDGSHSGEISVLIEPNEMNNSNFQLLFDVCGGAAELDCSGVCGGGGVEDNCGICDNDTTNDDETCTGCMDQNYEEYDEDATIPCEDCCSSITLASNENIIPSKFEIINLYPNPFNPQINIEYNLPTTSNVRVSIYNVKGQEVDRLVDSIKHMGFHSITWIATEQNSGIYFIQITADSNVINRKIMYLK